MQYLGRCEPGGPARYREVSRRSVGLSGDEAIGLWICGQVDVLGLVLGNAAAQEDSR
jgi:hypothetical protein